MKKALKIIGATFCGLATLGGIINTISPAATDTRAGNGILTFMFLVFTILFIRSILKNPNVRSMQNTQVQVQEHKSSKARFGGKICGCCGGKLHRLTATNVSDGQICILCNAICNGSMLATVKEIQTAWEENHRRFQVFNPTLTVTDFGCGFIYVDGTQKMCYLSRTKKTKTEPIIFKFSEISEFRIERVGEKTITKTKGGVGRALVGGAMFGGVGAIVGASTAKAETKTTGGISILSVDVVLNGLKTTIQLSNPPTKAMDFLENAMEKA